MKIQNRHAGFTLVEILIVLGIIAVVGAIFIPIVLNISERNQVAKGASLLENALAIAKARAVSTKRPSGVRLVMASDNLRNLAASTVGFAWYNELQYIEDPGDYVEAWVWGFGDVGPTPANPLPPPVRLSTQPYYSVGMPIPGVLPTNFDGVQVASGPFTFQALDRFGAVVPVTSNRNFLLFGPISMAPPNTWTGTSGFARTSQRLSFNYRAGQLDPDQAINSFVDVPAVLPGDMLEINGVGEPFRILAVSVDQGAFLNVNISASGQAIRVPVLMLDRALPTDIEVPLNSRPNYRIIRKPRIIPSLPVVKLPQDVVIDLTPSRFPLLGAGGDLDSSSKIYMSGVSTGIGMSAITNLTTGPSAIQGKAPRYVDIMFSSSGEIMSSSQDFANATSSSFFNIGQSGLIALWLHQRGDPNLWQQRQITAAQGNADNQAIVAINARTGFIGSYPMCLTGADPLAYARTGKARMSADTGP